MQNSVFKEALSLKSLFVIFKFYKMAAKSKMAHKIYIYIYFRNFALLKQQFSIEEGFIHYCLQSG
jgi:hypothetical protein